MDQMREGELKRVKEVEKDIEGNKKEKNKSNVVRFKKNTETQINFFLTVAMLAIHKLRRLYIKSHF